MAGINILGIGTLIDSLFTIKKIVFEDENCDYEYLVAQVKENFPDKSLALKCRNLKGKYGTDNPETNELARELSVFIADLVDNGEIFDNVIPYAGLFIFLHDIYSENFPATPDGRFAGERLSYGVGASDLCADKTITSMLNSTSHIAHDRFADGNPIMFSIPEKEVSGERGDVLLKSLIKSYFKNGGFHILINVTDSQTLINARENPQDYNDLIIRISGYSEYFTKLNDAMQIALIERS
jgi:formate C-acetyltransferase